jgi:tetratricopeptide (TPR) repeat protein
MNVLAITRKAILPVALAAAVVFGGAQQAFAQAGEHGATQTPQRNWKDRAEFDLYNSMTDAKEPAKKLELLNTWKEKYPQSDFAYLRRLNYLQVYTDLHRWNDVISEAQTILAKDANNSEAVLQALSKTLTAIFVVQNPTPDQLTTAQNAANRVITNADTLFSTANKPANMSDAQWATAKKEMQLLAQNTLGYVPMVEKQWDAAEAAFTKSLETNPDQGQISYYLYQVLINERKPEKYPAALFELARSGAYDGPGSLNAAGRQQVMSTLKNLYAQWHGGTDGLDQLIADAKTSALPPQNFTILNKQQVAVQQAAAEQKRIEDMEKTNPGLALWLRLKQTLTSDQGQAYFDAHMKDTEIPIEITGKLMSETPEARPKELVLAIANDTTPDATVELEAPMACKMDPGAEIGFKNGIALSYTANPFMVTFKVSRANVTGWKHCAPVRRRTRRR